jgi:hypothetical protein
MAGLKALLMIIKTGVLLSSISEDEINGVVHLSKI